MKKSQGFIISFLIILIVILASGSIYYYRKNRPWVISSADKNATSNCKTLIANDWNAGFQCIFDLGKKVSDYRACDILADTPQSKDPNVQKQDFVSVCKINYAVAKKDASICFSMRSFSDQMTQAVQISCIGGVVSVTKDTQACTAISDPAMQSRCVAAGKDGIDKCKTLIKEDEKNYCYQRLATQEKDAALCNQITGLTASSDKEFCVADVARSKIDWQMCNTIKTVSTRDWCVANVIELNNLDSELCNNAGSRKNLCKQTRAMMK
jgi:hypothetical protein